MVNLQEFDNGDGGNFNMSDNEKKWGESFDNDHNKHGMHSFSMNNLKYSKNSHSQDNLQGSFGPAETGSNFLGFSPGLMGGT